MLIIFVVLAAFGLAAFTYLGLERLGRRAWIPLGCRAIAWSALGLLLVNVSCPVSGAPLRPLVLLDASLSMGAAGGRWAEAEDSAARWGEVRHFGDTRDATANEDLERDFPPDGPKVDIIDDASTKEEESGQRIGYGSDRSEEERQACRER